MSTLHRQFEPLKRNPHTDELYLQLPAPHDNIIITPPRMSDAAAMSEILNDPRIYKWLLSPPYPYLLEHAESWLASAKERSDALINVLKEAPLKGERDDIEGSDNTREMPVYFDGCPVHTLREVQPDGSDTYLGSIDIPRRAHFEYLRDKEKEEAVISRNKSLPVGSPEIIWDIGNYLKPSHHGKGIMSAAVRMLLRDWAIPRMNAHTIFASAFAGNAGSVKVFLKNEFTIFDFVDDCVNIPESKGGGRVTMHFLEWRRLALEQ